jgi:hypothetical protein
MPAKERLAKVFPAGASVALKKSGLVRAFHHRFGSQFINLIAQPQYEPTFLCRIAFVPKKQILWESPDSFEDEHDDEDETSELVRQVNLLELLTGIGKG